VVALALGVADPLTCARVCPIRSASAELAPADASAGEFSLVLLPDTQFYALRHPHTFVAQTRWIVENLDRLAIRAVIHLGDITHRNTKGEWRAADRALELLDGEVPYTVLPGNHDGRARGRIATELFNRTFPPSRYEDRPWYGGHMGETNDNCFIFFEARGMEFLVVSLAYGTTREALAWADRVVSDHPHRRVIVATHAYMNHDRTRLVRGERAAVRGKTWTDGDEIWDTVIKRHPNIFLVVSGHIHGGGYATARGDHGNLVHQVLSDFQRLPGGGSGYLSILTFAPAEDLIRVRTYSPTLDRALTAADYSFELPYRMLGAGRERTID